MKDRLFIKIFVSYLALSLFAVMTVGIILARQVKHELMAEFKDELRIQVRLTAMLPIVEIEKNIKVIADKSRSRVTLIDASGWIKADSEINVITLENYLNRPEIQEARVRGQGENIRFNQALGVDVLYVAVPIKEGEHIKAYIRFMRQLDNVKKSIDGLHQTILYGIFLFLLPSLLAAIIYSRKVISPLEKMEIFTGKVCRGEEPGTLMIDSKDIIGQLGKNIDCMFTEHKSKIKIADAQKSKLESTFASMKEGVLVLDNNNRIELINKGLQDIIGHQISKDIIGKTPIEGFRNIQLQSAFEQFKKTREPVSREIILGEAAPIICELSISNIYGSAPGEEKTLMVFHDITRLKKLEKVREDFVANVTHEIKTPLTAIIGFVETLQEGAIEDKESANKFLQVISQNAHRLNRLVSDLITLSSIETGDIKLQFEEVSIHDIIENILPVFEAKATGKGILINADIPKNISKIMTDRDKIFQILLNILDNAVKFTPDGGRITITASEHDKEYVALKIIDTGIGIPSHEISRLGERFYRVDKTRSRELGGTGLGLSIVKHLMKALNGRLEIESEMKKGTTVSLFFQKTN